MSHTKRITSYFLIIFLVLVLSTTSALGAAAATNKSLMLKVPNNKVGNETCSNFGAFTANGSTGYALKTNSTNTVATLYTIKNYNDPSKATISNKVSIKGLYHANCVAYYNGRLYVAAGISTETTRNQVISMNLNGGDLKYYKGDKKISAITYYKDGKFIAVTGQYNRSTSATKLNGYVIKLQSDKTIYYGRDFTITQPGKGSYNYTKSQGSFYNPEDKCLYTIHSFTNEHTRNNHVYKQNLGSDVVSGKHYSSSKTFAIHAKSANTTLFELESWYMDGTKKYCGGNISSENDAIYRITND